MLLLSLELARSVLDAAPDAMLIIDASGTVRFANRQVTTLFGYDHDDIVGKPVELLMPARYRERHVAARRGYFDNLRMRPMGLGLELFGRRRDGSEFPVEISLSPVKQGDEPLVAAAIRDVSERQRAQAQLVLARGAAERAREGAEAARASADEAREAAVRANQAKSRFLATASHDLRQPLQALSLLNGMLRRSVSEPEAAQALLHQEQAIGAMSRLLNALLDISKLESGAIRPDPTDFDVSALFQELRLEFAALADSKGLALRVAAGQECAHCDRALVEQILKNLLSNAIKYTSQGSVSLRCVHTGADRLRIEVQDTGLGIAPEQLHLIYDEFYQVGVPANSAREGYGLGLSIVQRLVKLIGAALEVTSELGKGSVFALTIPTGAAVLVRKGAAAAPRAAPPAAQPPGFHVLLVEDDAAVRNATRLLLKSAGYTVSTATSRAEALRQGPALPRLDLILTDYHLAEGQTGMQVIAALREQLGRPLAAVMITGDTSLAMRDLGMQEHVRVISKPVQAEELLEVMRSLSRA